MLRLREGSVLLSTLIPDPDNAGVGISELKHPFFLMQEASGDK